MMAKCDRKGCRKASIVGKRFCSLACYRLSLRVAPRRCGCGAVIHRTTKHGKCAACWQKAGHSKEHNHHKCALAGCENRVTRSDRKFCSTECYRAGTASRTKPQSFSGDLLADVKNVSTSDELRRVQTAYRSVVEDQAHEERVLRLFRDAIDKFPKLPDTAFACRKKSDQPRRAPSSDIPVLLLGDQHIGEEISIEETHGINSYNFAVYQQRLEHLEDRVLDILSNHQKGPYSELVVLSLGDNVSGVIHEELQKHGHQHIVDQVYLGALTMALFLRRLLALGPFPKIRLSCVSGNHGRLSDKKESKRYYKNFDYLFNSIVATALRDIPQIQIHIPRCLFTVVEVAGHRILQSHGHELPPSSLGIPLYSVNRGSAAYQELFSIADGSRFDYWVMGHYHRPAELDNSIINGTMAGLGEFGIGKFKPIRPMQKLLGFNTKWGKAWEYPIRLDKSPEATRVYTFSAAMHTDEAVELFDRS